MKDKVNCGDGDIYIVDNCEKCGLVDWCSGDCKWSNGTCVLRGKFLLLQKPIHLIKDVENST